MSRLILLGKALGVIAAIHSFTEASYSAEMPPEFAGIWSIATETDNQCWRSDWQNSRKDGMISVAARSIDYWETSCKISNVNESSDSTVEVGLACSGEGTTWRSDEIWHVQKVGLRKQLISVSLRRSDERDESGKPFKNKEKHEISVSVFLECK